MTDKRIAISGAIGKYARIFRLDESGYPPTLALVEETTPSGVGYDVINHTTDVCFHPRDLRVIVATLLANNAYPKVLDYSGGSWSVAANPFVATITTPFNFSAYCVTYTPNGEFVLLSGANNFYVFRVDSPTSYVEISPSSLFTNQPGSTEPALGHTTTENFFRIAFSEDGYIAAIGSRLFYFDAATSKYIGFGDSEVVRYAGSVALSGVSSDGSTMYRVMSKNLSATPGGYVVHTIDRSAVPPTANLVPSLEPLDPERYFAFNPLSVAISRDSGWNKASSGPLHLVAATSGYGAYADDKPLQFGRLNDANLHQGGGFGTDVANAGHQLAGSVVLSRTDTYLVTLTFKANTPGAAVEYVPTDYVATLAVWDWSGSAWNLLDFVDYDETEQARPERYNNPAVPTQSTQVHHVAFMDDAYPLGQNSYLVESVASSTTPFIKQTTFNGLLSEQVVGQSTLFYRLSVSTAFQAEIADFSASLTDRLSVSTEFLSVAVNFAEALFYRLSRSSEFLTDTAAVAGAPSSSRTSYPALQEVMELLPYHVGTNAFFDPAHIGTDITLLNANLSAAYSGNAFSPAYVDLVRSTGKHYAKFYVDIYNAAGQAFGVDTDHIKGNVDGGFSQMVYYNGFVIKNGAILMSGVSKPSGAGQWANVAVDFDAGKLWLGINDVYYGSGNPTTGANPSATFTPNTPLYLVVSPPEFTGQVTAQLSPGSFSGAPLTGFEPWADTVIDGATTPTATLHTYALDSLRAATAEVTRVTELSRLTEAVVLVSTVAPYFIKLIAETAAITGTATGIHAILRNIAESMVAHGVATTNLRAIRLLVQALQVADTADRAQLLLLIESLNSTATPVALLRALNLAAESLVLADVVTRGVIVIRSVTEHAVAAANVTARAVLRELLAEGIAFEIGFGSAFGLFDTWVVNAETTAGSQYTGLDFNSYASRRGVSLAASATGLYALGGDDDAGTRIAASILTGRLDFGLPTLKNVHGVYLGYSATKGLALKVVTTDADGALVENWYKIEGTQVGEAIEGRIPTGRGVEARYWQFEILNQQGGDFSIDAADYDVMPLNRRLR